MNDKNKTGEPENGLVALAPTDFNQSLPSMIASTEFFSGFSGEDIEILSQFAHAFRAPSGVNIIEEGNNNPMLCLIVSGSVVVLKQTDKGAQRTITTLGAGRLVGEMSIVDDMPFSATAQSAESTIVVLFHKAELTKLQQEHPALSITLLQNLAQLVSSRLRSTTDTLASYLARTADLTEALSQAMKTARDKSNFFASMSHELRTPLNAIVGFSELLEEEIELSNCDSCVDDAKRIREASRHLLKLVGNILDLSKIEAGKMQLYLETFPVKSLLEEIVATADPLITKNNNKLVFECDLNVGEMNADQTQIRQVLLNLLSNAAKFTNDGEIKLVVTCGNNSSELITFEVSDTGIGMNEVQVKMLFEKFSQTDASIRSKFGGTGLGLAISRSICHMVGGELTVESQPGKGSTFVATLPRQFSS